MTKASEKPPVTNTPDTFELVASTMKDFREAMESFDAVGVRIAVRTRFIMRLVFTTLTLSSIYLVYMIMEMTDNMNAMTAHMEDMYINFGTMSQDMDQISHMVDSMGKNISGNFWKPFPKRNGSPIKEKYWGSLYIRNKHS